MNRKYTMNRKYICNFCNKQISNNFNLSKHMAICKRKDVADFREQNHALQQELERQREAHQAELLKVREALERTKELEMEVKLLTKQLEDEKLLVKTYQDKLFELVRHSSKTRLECTEWKCTNFARAPSSKCVSHGGGPRCTHVGCEHGARSGSKKCVAHGGGPRCPNCIDWLDARMGSSYYDGYCATCFKRLFPEDSRSTVIHRQSKEIRVRNAITERAQSDLKFQGFVHNQPLYTGDCDCTHRRRVDHRKLIDGTMLAVETDEFAHRYYDAVDEEIRYHDLYMIHSGKWVFIRFNPDPTETDKTDLDDRIEVLLTEIEKQIYRISVGANTDLLEVVKLYYPVCKK